MVWPLPISLAATSGIDFSFSSSGYLDVSVLPVYLLISYVFTNGYLRFASSGFPHSDICGSMSTCDSPQLFAADRVLLRLLVPRHPPYALNNLTLLMLLSFGSLILYL